MRNYRAWDQQMIIVAMIAYTLIPFAMILKQVAK